MRMGPFYQARILDNEGPHNLNTRNIRVLDSLLMHNPGWPLTDQVMKKLQNKKEKKRVQWIHQYHFMNIQKPTMTLSRNLASY